MTAAARPAIVYLHGMAGGHLERGGEKIWLSAPHLLRGDVGEQLRASGLSPAGHIKLFHRPAAYYWRRRGFAVHEFAYDWRQSLDDCAADLHRFVAPLGPVMLIGHSMGGCVALRYASLCPDNRVTRAVLVGVPACGTFSAVEVLLGKFLLPRMVAAAAGPRNSRQVLDDLRRTASTMAGLVDLLPDPAVFPTAALLYRSENWPEGSAPAQALLDRSLALKAELAASPLFAQSLVLSARRWPTPCAVELRDERIALLRQTAPGDGVTLAESAWPAAAVAREEIVFPHAFQLWEPAVLRASIRDDEDADRAAV